jgi:xanthine dehydrogenase small subunit
MMRQGIAARSPAVWMPDTLSEAWQLKQQFGSEASYIAGGTLLQTHWEKGVPRPANLISLERIKELQGIGKSMIAGETSSRVGSLTPISICRTPPPYLNEHLLLVEAARNIAAPAIRNRATVGGNITNGFGDLIPALLAMDAELSFFCGKDYKRISVSDWILTDFSTSNEILVCVYLPDKIEPTKEAFFYKKVGLREAFSPSIVTVSGCCQRNGEGKVGSVRLAVGGSSIPPQRLIESENLIKGSVLSNKLLQELSQMVKKEFTPSEDRFSSAVYKQMVTANIIVSKLARIAGQEGSNDTTH